MTTYLDLQNEVLNHGFDPNTYRARVKTWLNEALSMVARRAEMPAAQANSTIVTISGTADYTVPTDLVRIFNLRDEVSDYELTAISVREYDELNDTALGKPSAYALYGQTLSFYPTPNAVFTFNLRYMKGYTSLSADTDVPGMADEYLNILASFALSRAFRAEDDYEASQFYMSEFMRDLGKMANDVQYRDKSFKRQIQGLKGPRSTAIRFTRPG